MINVVVAEQHPITRDNIRMLLEKSSEVTIIGEAIDGETAVALVKQHVPDVLITDIIMSGSNGFDIVKEVVDLKLPTRIIVISMFTDEVLVRQALKAGANSYLSKRGLAKNLLIAIKRALNGASYLNADTWTPELYK